MNRRRFCTSSLGLLSVPSLPGLGQTPAGFPSAPGLTKYVADFIVKTKYEDIPPNVLELGRKSILDGFGLALAGSVSEMGPLVRQYIETLGVTNAKASVIGSRMKVPSRFAALANGIIIHADD